jgi:ankyrin repeat protein
VDYLITKGGGANFTMGLHLTAREAAKYGHVHILEYLALNRVNMYDEAKSLLHLAANKGRIEVIKYLMPFTLDKLLYDTILQLDINWNTIPVIQYFVPILLRMQFTKRQKNKLRETLKYAKYFLSKML